MENVNFVHLPFLQILYVVKILSLSFYDHIISFTILYRILLEYIKLKTFLRVISHSHTHLVFKLCFINQMGCGHIFDS